MSTIEQEAIVADLQRKLAERDAEVERLKSARKECERQYQAKVEETVKEMARAEAAERAREGAISRFADAYDAGFMASGEGYNGEYGPDTDSAHYKSKRDEWLAAFLAASGEK